MSEFIKFIDSLSDIQKSRLSEDKWLLIDSAIKSFNSIQAERDALAVKLSELEKALKPLFDHGSWFISAVEIDSHAADGEQIRLNLLNALNATPQHHLASHDAEVAENAVNDFCEWMLLSKRYSVAEWCGEYTNLLRAKAGE